MIIKGKETVLRPITLKDAPRFVRWLHDPLVAKFLRGRLSKISLKEEIKWIKSLSKKSQERHFAIDTKNNIHIGSVGLFLDKYNQNAKFGILIGDKSYWDKGLGTETTKLMMNYAFNRFKLHRVELTVYSFNKRAIHIYKKLGFELEGIKRQHLWFKNKFYDEYQMGLLREEFNS